jgi:chemotaxis protein methyltransferase CheR
MGDLPYSVSEPRHHSARGSLGSDSNASIPMSTSDYVSFLQWALPRLGMRWPGFRKVHGQVCKRIRRRMAELGFSDFSDYRGHLEAQSEEWRVLDSFCRITISRFYRDRRVFELLEQRVLPTAAASAREGTVRCWSAGCASGEEPYTLAILWRLGVKKRFPNAGFQIIATDADEVMLERAERACYPTATLRELPEPYVEAAVARANDELCLRTAFRRYVQFERQDIREEMPDGPFDIILCRNLAFTYFDDVQQARVLTEMLERLQVGGHLVLGAHEDLPAGDWPLELTEKGEPLYRLV